MSTVNSSTHGVNPDSIEVRIRQFDRYVSLDLEFTFAGYLSESQIPAQYGLIISERDGYNLHDALVTLRALFPKHTYEDCR